MIIKGQQDKVEEMQKLVTTLRDLNFDYDTIIQYFSDVVKDMALDELIGYCKAIKLHCTKKYNKDFYQCDCYFNLGGECWWMVEPRFPYSWEIIE